MGDGATERWNYCRADMNPNGKPQDTHRVRREPCKVLIFSGCNSHPATGPLQPVPRPGSKRRGEETKPSKPSRGPRDTHREDS